MDYKKQMKIPEGMLKAAHEKAFVGMGTSITERILEAALRWLSENPIVPTDEQIDRIHREANPSAETAIGRHWEIRNWLIEWQRRIFLAPEPEIPEEVKDLLYRHPKGLSDGFVSMDTADENTIEAYRRGQQSREK